MSTALRSRGRLVALIVVVMLVVGGAFAVLTSATTGDSGPRAAIPRVCWFSDYANAKLSNQCTYRSDEQRWYMRVAGQEVPADEQSLPPANLCLYFHGTACPSRTGGSTDRPVPEEGSDDDRR